MGVLGWEFFGLQGVLALGLRDFRDVRVQGFKLPDGIGLNGLRVYRGLGFRSLGVLGFRDLGI